MSLEEKLSVVEEMRKHFCTYQFAMLGYAMSVGDDQLPNQFNEDVNRVFSKIEDLLIRLDKLGDNDE